MLGRLSIAAMAFPLACAAPPTASPPPTEPEPFSSTGSPPTASTATGYTPVICADPGRRDERAFDLYEGAEWTGQAWADTADELLIGGGLAVDDYDGDGHLDLFLPDRDGSRLFLSDGAGGWTDATESHLPEATSDQGVAAVAVDIDGDGDRDVYLSRHLRPDQLLLNLGAGRFTVDTRYAPDPLMDVASAWADLDGDGDLDGFLARYGVETVPETDQPNAILRNDGGTLTPEALPEGLARGHTLVPGLLDLDDDRDPDLYAVNDFGWILPNHVGWNEPTGFRPDPQTGLDFAINGMGLGVADLNGDELPDLLVTGWSEYALMLSQGPGLWARAPEVLSWSGDPGDQDVGWAVELADLDNDGDDDAYVVHGFVDGLGIGEQRPPLLQPDAIFVQQDGVFSDRAAEWGHVADGVGRGAVLADLNGDGWLDIAARDKAGPPQIFLARCGDASWLRIRLDQGGANPDAIGAVVRITSGDDRWIRWVRAGGTGFASGGPPEVHVGLGDREVVDVEVTWPDGTVSAHPEVPARQLVSITRPDL